VNRTELHHSNELGLQESPRTSQNARPKKQQHKPPIKTIFTNKKPNKTSIKEPDNQQGCELFI
jgi:hypothetical protein